MKRPLAYLMLGIMLLTVNKIAIAKEEFTEKIYHFVFKAEKTISDSDNEAIFDNFRNKIDTLGINRVSIIKDRDLFIVTTKSTIKPDDIISQIQFGEFSVPLTLVTYFICDVAQKNEHFLGELNSAKIEETSGTKVAGGIIVERESN